MPNTHPEKKNNNNKTKHAPNQLKKLADTEIGDGAEIALHKLTVRVLCAC